MKSPLLERRSPVWISYALLILVVFFFLLPFAFRGARQSLHRKENDVKDWLPKDFPETSELNWFADHFVGESFVLATWPGCTSGDDRLRLLQQKLMHESEAYDPTVDVPEEMVETYRRARQVGKELQLLRAGEDDHFNWGGQQEKWLQSASGKWYYITPDGRLYRWDEPSNAPYAAIRSAQKSLDKLELQGQFVTGFGDQPVSKIANPFYNDPSLLCAPLFQTVETGDTLIAELACEDGPLWPIDLTEENRRHIVAKRLAMERFTGTLFAPAVPSDFAWTPQAFREVIPQQQRDGLPEDFDFLVEQSLTQIVDQQYEGSLPALESASTAAKADAWYTIFDAAGVPPPPRATCVLVTLTDVAKENLPYVLGRGVLGGPRGRLLQLAEEAGISAAPPPSLAPPPFDSEPVERLAGMPPLRLGGPPVDNVAIDEEGTVTLVRLVGYSIIIGIVLSFLCFGSVKITVMVFIVGGSSAMLSMAMVWWTDGQVDAILMSMPSLVYVLGLSGAIHVINYYRDEVRARGQRGAPGRALRHALLPCTLASVTTAIGLVSLFTSNLAPISNFGLYSAIGVITTLGILFSYLPAALQIFPPGIGGRDTDSPAPEQVPKESWLSECWAAVGRWITRHHGLVATTCLAVLLVGSLGLMKIETSVQLLKLFDSQSRIIEDYAWLEDNFGKLVPMELVVRVPPSMQAETYDGDQPTQQQPLNMLERMEAVSRVATVVRRTLGEPGRGIVGQSISAETFLPQLPEPSNGWSMTRSKFNKDLTAGRDDLLTTDYLRLEAAGPYAGSELWRISLRVGALSDVDYGLFISTLRTAVEPVMRAYETRDVLMEQLAKDDAGESIKISGKDQIIVVGTKRPPTLDEIELVSGEDQEIHSGNIFLGALAEILSCERIRKPGWIDPATDDPQWQPGGEKWNEWIGGRADAVVWLGGDGVKEEHFAGTKRLIDARDLVNKKVQPTLTASGVPDAEGSGSLQVVYTGVIPVVYKAQRTLLTSLANSIGLAFVLIAGVMIMLLNPGRFPFGVLRPGNLGNGIAAGTVSMVPNVFPVLLVFGVMCHAGIKIDIGTMMTASVAMGVAVDDTIHFLSWFRTNLDRGLGRVEAVIETYRRVGPAMTQTTIVGGLGLFVFALSTFTPTQRFGTLMLVMLSAALIGDLVLLPALLAGPAGRWFKPRLHRVKQLAQQPSPPSDEPEDSGADQTEQAEEETREAVASSSDGQSDSVPQLRVHFPAQRSRTRRLK